MTGIGDAPPQARQPYLQDLVTAVRAPAVALSAGHGQLDGTPAAGFYVADRRVLSRFVVTVDGWLPEPVGGQSVGADAARFVGAVRHLGDRSPDPTVFVERERQVSATGVDEVVRLVSRAREGLRCTVGIELATDLADMADVKDGRPVPDVPATVTAHGVRWEGPDGVRVAAELDPPGDRLQWTVEIGPRESWSVTVRVRVETDPVALAVAPPPGPAWRPVAVTAGDHRLPELVRQSLADLGALLAADPDVPGDRLLSAGAPWYLTLFGRDSLWAARLALPLGTDLAAGTLRTLARRQGVTTDPATGQEPGKILHEVRRSPAGPDVHYGTVDATSLWVSLLHDAWRWGLPEAEVAALLPNLERALDWHAAAAGDGFVRYADLLGQGHSNQGWKDSYDSVQFADGTLAATPIALCEVQAYAYAAARQGADLLDAFGRPGGGRWREWASALRDRFRAGFWVHGFPAIALDRDGRPVDTVSSNLGHLLGTGLLDAAEEERVVALLAGPDMDSGAGLRTLSSRSTGYNPLSYHGGSVWAHDTAIAVHGLTAVGGPAAGAAAASLVRGLLAAGAAFDWRLPELHGGETLTRDRRPLPYPAACRPQAWSAAGAVVLLTAILGLAPDVPAGRIRLAPLRPSPVGELTVRGLRVAGRPLDVDLTADGQAKIVESPSGLQVQLD